MSEFFIVNPVTVAEAKPELPMDLNVHQEQQRGDRDGHNVYQRLSEVKDNNKPGYSSQTMAPASKSLPVASVSKTAETHGNRGRFLSGEEVPSNTPVVPESLQILDMTERTIKINEEVLNSVLTKVGDRPFVVYSMNGQTRTGKSYLLNYFIRYFEGKKRNNPDWFNLSLPSEFKWQSGRDRTTVGINLWSEPYILTTREGEEVAVLLLDTQGLFDEQTTVRQNAIIFAISILSSSVMIFNQMQSMNEDLLQKIQFFSQYAHTATADPSSAPKSDSGNHLLFKDVFQKLLFVIRDFQFPDYEFGAHTETQKPEGSRKNFFTDTFHIDNELPGYPEENKLVRTNIQELFENIAVYPLPDPGKRFRRQDTMTGGSDASSQKAVEPDEEFQEHLKSFIEWTMSEENLVRKKVAGQFVTGRKFKESVQRWGDLCRKAEVTFPYVPTMTESTAITHYSIAQQLALKKYDSLMDMDVLSNDVDLDSHHNFARNDSIKLFHKIKKIKIDNEGFKKKFLDQLETDIAEHFRIVKTYHEATQKLKQEEKNFENASLERSSYHSSINSNGSPNINITDSDQAASKKNSWGFRRAFSEGIKLFGGPGGSGTVSSQANPQSSSPSTNQFQNRTAHNDSEEKRKNTVKRITEIGSLQTSNTLQITTLESQRNAQHQNIFDVCSKYLSVKNNNVSYRNAYDLLQVFQGDLKSANDQLSTTLEELLGLQSEQDSLQKELDQITRSIEFVSKKH